MPFIRMPSRALIQALGWDVIEEIDNYFENVAEEIRAERRRLEATRHELLYPPGREADMLRRIADVEYHLCLEMSRAGQRLRREIQDLKDEVRQLREAFPALEEEREGSPRAHQDAGVPTLRSQEPPKPAS